MPERGHMPDVQRDVVTQPPTDAERPDLYGLLILGLLIIVLISVVAGFVLSWANRATPESLWAIGLVAVGALAGMLAPRASA